MVPEHSFSAAYQLTAGAGLIDSRFQLTASPIGYAEKGGLVGCTHDQRGGSRAIFFQLEIIFSMIQSPS
jgi:hypothetical protein